MSEFSDEAFRGSIDALRDALARLGRVRDAIDWQEDVRQRVDRQVAAIDCALDELELVYDEACAELL